MKWEVSGSRIRGKNIDGVVNITLCEEPCLSHLTDYSILTEEERFLGFCQKYVCRFAFQLAKKNALKILLKRKRKHREEIG